MINLSEKTKIFTENFIDLFNSTNLSKTKFANLVGLKHSQIQHYLQGLIPVTDSVVKICDYFNCSIDYLCGITEKTAYPNMKKGFDKTSFFTEYQRLLKINNISHFYLAKQNIVTQTSLSLWKKGGLPKFEVLIAIAYELGGSIDKLLGRI